MCFWASNFLNLQRITWIMGLAGILFYSSNISGQNYFTENFTIDAGLPSNTVRAIFKDSRGLMWIGTASGLCRFDGREFIIYNSSNGLAAENIFDITEDNRGNLWIGSMGGGISTFDGKKFTNYSSKDGLVCNEVRRVWWSRKFNVLLVGTNKGCSVFDGNQFYSLTASEIAAIRIPGLFLVSWSGMTVSNSMLMAAIRLSDTIRQHTHTRRIHQRGMTSPALPVHPLS